MLHEPSWYCFSFHRLMVCIFKYHFCRIVCLWSHHCSVKAYDPLAHSLGSNFRGWRTAWTLVSMMDLILIHEQVNQQHYSRIYNLYGSLSAMVPDETYKAQLLSHKNVTKLGSLNHTRQGTRQNRFFQLPNDMNLKYYLSLFLEHKWE